jgi:hypothetical protein
MHQYIHTFSTLTLGWESLLQCLPLRTGYLTMLFQVPECHVMCNSDWAQSDSIVNHRLHDERILHNGYVNNNYPSYLTSSNNLKVFHQNIRGLKYKTDELISALCPDFPHVLCITDHMNSLDRNIICIDHYNIGAVYCKNSISKGGMCIFVSKNINLDIFVLTKL